MNILNQPPLGLKQPKAEKPRRKPVRKISAKKAAYMASPKRKRAKEHMAAVAMLPCLVCGAYGVEVHHEYGPASDPNSPPRSDFRVLPLCPRHHKKEFGPGARHYNRNDFHAAHGSSEELLDRVNEMLRKADDDALGEWF